jgi:hydroxymethylglutaryl-CoA lyase
MWTIKDWYFKRRKRFKKVKTTRKPGGNMDNRVWITDVSPRDGIQNEAEPVTTEDKVKLVNSLAAAGVPAIEVTSFVHPKFVPQMADAEEVMKQIERLPNTRYEVLVPNLRGAIRALAVQPDQLNLVVSASESHNQANLKTGTFQTLENFKEVSQLVKKEKVRLKGGIATSFGCPFEGIISTHRVLQVVDAYIDLGVDCIGLADTTGMANPSLIQEVIQEVRKRWNDIEIHLHLHNTRGAGLANLYAGYLEGIRHFDASLGGIGGCPFAPGATGNISTEDTVNMLHDMGIITGIGLDQLLLAAKNLEEALKHELPGQVIKAGKTLHLHPMPTITQF